MTHELKILPQYYEEVKAGNKNFELRKNDRDYSESIEEDYCWNGDSREKHCPLREVEAIPKADYEARLKAEKITMLEELKTEIEGCYSKNSLYFEMCAWNNAIDVVDRIIQQKINALKGL
jgi:hypothetical protein